MSRATIVPPAASRRAGFALVTVVLVLAALLVLLTPFLVSARNSDRASTQLFDRSQTRLALDTASAHARASLERSHFAYDATPYYDAREEIEVSNDFASDFYDASDANGVMWDLEVEDVAGRVDLESAPPQVIANLMGVSTRLTRPLTEDDDTLPVASTRGLRPKGFVWVGGELVQYAAIQDGELVQLERGFGVILDADGEPLPGPLPASAHGVGTAVIDQRALAPVLWRSLGGDVRRFDSYEQLAELDEYVLDDEGFGADARATLRRTCSTHGGVRGGSRWQRAARMTSAAERDLTGHVSVDSPRWFNSGSTILIDDGLGTETAMVRDVGRSGALLLDRALSQSYDAYAAEVRVLARRPVNLNTASPEVLQALFLNLQIAGRNSRVDGTEARSLAALIVESRPLTGFEDLLRRVVLPAAGIEEPPADAGHVPDSIAAGGTVIDGWDALAVYINGLNANSRALAFSTMPYCFVTRDTYELDLRATVNAKSGVERYAAVREEVRLVVPQDELLQLWSRQEDYDEELRLTREAPWWMSGPEATSRPDVSNGAVPPSRFPAHIGSYDGQVFVPGVIPLTGQYEEQPSPEHVFASQEDEGWAQLWASRTDEMGQRDGHVHHFDNETRSPEGRYLPDQVFARDTLDPQIDWTTPTGLLRPFQFRAWVRPRSAADGYLLDVAGTSNDSDRASILFDGTDLVLRVLDAGGDHAATAFREQAEVRYSIAGGTDPGLPLETWHHVEVDVRGTRADQMSMLVNGMTHGVRTLGMSRLTQQVSENDPFLPLESTEGFPPRGVARIGQELVEFRLQAGGLMCQYVEAGQEAGFGGRNARVGFTPGDATTPPDNAVPSNIGIVDRNHPAGTTVELEGYSLPLTSRTPTGMVSLPDQLGLFRVACAVGVEGGSETNGDAILWRNQFGFAQQLGYGIEGTGSGVTGLVLAPAEDPSQEGGPDLMAAFNRSGGYAVVCQTYWNGMTIPGTPIGSWEVVRYSGYDGTTLQIAQRGVGTAELPGLGNGTQPGGNHGPHAFITTWTTTTPNGEDFQDNLYWRTFVYPISIPAPGASPTSFMADGAAVPQYAQLTRPGQAEQTEWVGFDDAVNGQLVRSSGLFLSDAYDVLTRGARPDPPSNPNPPGGGGGGGGGGTGGTDAGTPGDTGGVGGGGSTGGTPGGSGIAGPTAALGPAAAGPSASSSPPPAAAASSASAAAPASPAPAPATAPAGPLLGAQWQPMLGAPEDVDYVVSRAVRDVLQHRGALSTFAHRHPAGTRVLPVFRVQMPQDNGRPGRFDAAFLFGAQFNHVGWPVRVHRAIRPPGGVVVHDWAPRQQWEPVAVAGNTYNSPQHAYTTQYYVALDDAAPEPIQPGIVAGANAANVVDTRAYARLTLFPSGERPRIVTNVAVGGGARSGGGTVPACVVDELVFGSTEFGSSTPAIDPESTRGAQLVVREPFAVGAQTLRVWSNSIRIPLGQISSVREYLSDLHQDAGLLRIGEEILAYDQLSPSDGYVTVAVNGRGLLGTVPQPHAVGEPVTFLSHQTVGALSGGVGGGDAALPLTDLTEFPPEGTVLVGRELVHFTRQRSGALEMPRASTEPGAMDQRGDGIFRGRYGTEPQGHSAGEPVILFPFRYWDRWAERADGPELAYFDFDLDQPAAWVRSFFWIDEPTGHAGPALGALLRTDPDVPWDADPEDTEGLALHHEGLVDGDAVPVGAQSDHAEWRVFVEYQPGSFDYDTGLAHGWRATPRMKQLGVFYIAPGMTLRSVER